jgi:hypothetical protein
MVAQWQPVRLRVPFLRLPIRVPLGLALAAILAACGTHGSAGALPPTGHASLVTQGSQQAAGTAKLTPLYGAHIVVYLAGHKIPYDNAQNPVELRSATCTGSVLAVLTANAPMPSGTAAQQMPVTRPDPAGGEDVALTPDASWHVVVLAAAGGPQSKPIACGNPLSGHQQYFDLYPPDVGSNGMAQGIALLQPQIYTRVTVTLSQPVAQNETWAIHQQSCGGTVIASGTVSSGATTSQGIAFAELAADQWWVSVGTGDEATGGACGEVK